MEQKNAFRINARVDGTALDPHSVPYLTDSESLLSAISTHNYYQIDRLFVAVSISLFYNYRNNRPRLKIRTNFEIVFVSKQRWMIEFLHWIGALEAPRVKFPLIDPNCNVDQIDIIEEYWSHKPQSMATSSGRCCNIGRWLSTLPYLKPTQIFMLGVNFIIFQDSITRWSSKSLSNAEHGFV